MSNGPQCVVVNVCGCERVSRWGGLCRWRRQGAQFAEGQERKKAVEEQQKDGEEWREGALGARRSTTGKRAPYHRRAILEPQKVVVLAPLVPAVKCANMSRQFGLSGVMRAACRERAVLRMYNSKTTTDTACGAPALRK